MKTANATLGADNTDRGGLEGVVVADTRLSDVDGEHGRLIIAGRDIEALSGHVSFEAACSLLWETTEAGTRAALARGRARAWERLGSIGDALAAPNGMDALRAAMAHSWDDEACENADICGAVAVFAAAWSRRQSGLSPIRPDETLGHAADLLRMIQGAAPDAAHADAFDAYLVTVIDHGMNASTFAARVVTSTGSDAVSAVTAAIGALKGPLHGGAPGPVLDMLDAVGRAERAPAWLEQEVASGRRIMGMGHRIYRVRDPRAAALERALLRLEAAGVGTPRLALARAIERAAEEILRIKVPARPLCANVEFYTAVLLDAVGLERGLFAPMFAVSRVAGWCGHIDEQRKVGRLIRPSSRYVGRRPDTDRMNIAP